MDTLDFMQDRLETLEQWASEEATPDDAMRRLKGMVTRDIDFDFEINRAAIEEIVIATFERIKRTIATPAPNITNVYHIHDNDHCTVILHPETPAAKPIAKRLDFIRINDDSLKFNDRIIFSYIRHWSHENRKAKHEKRLTRRITIRRIRRATGFRPQSISESISRLAAGGYINDGTLTPKIKVIGPNRDPRTMGFDQMSWVQIGEHKEIRKHVLAEFIRCRQVETGRHLFAGYYAKCLGMSRFTVGRALQSGNGCSPGGNGCSP